MEAGELPDLTESALGSPAGAPASIQFLTRAIWAAGSAGPPFGISLEALEAIRRLNSSLSALMPGTRTGRVPPVPRLMAAKVSSASPPESAGVLIVFSLWQTAQRACKIGRMSLA